MVATEEETAPALPPRASSREFGAGPSLGAKVTVAVLSVVALLGAGAGVAYKQGMLDTVVSKAEASLPMQREQKSKSDEVDASEPAELAYLHRHAADAKESTHDPNHQASNSDKPHLIVHDRTSTKVEGDGKSTKSHHASPAHHDAKNLNDTRHTGNASAHPGAHVHNGTHATNGTEVHNSSSDSSEHIARTAARNATANHSHNATHNTTTGHNETEGRNVSAACGNATRGQDSSLACNASNATNATLNVTNATNATDEHKHVACKGGPLAACQCIFACKVFGARPSMCSGEKVQLLDSLVQKALNSTKEACMAMQCIVRCSKTLKCYDEKIQNDCRHIENRSAGLFNISNGTRKGLRGRAEYGGCKYECDADEDDKQLVNTTITKPLRKLTKLEKKPVTKPLTK